MFIEDGMKFESLNNGASNEVLQVDDDCYISFNHHPGGGFSLFEADDHSSETALCCDGKFFILNGDFREEYLEAAQKPNPFEACVSVYQSNKAEHNSSWTTDTDFDTWLSARLSN